MEKPFGAWISRPIAGDDALGRGAIEAEGVADCDRRVTDPHAAGVGEPQRLHAARYRAGVDLHEGEVARRVGAAHLAHRSSCRRIRSAPRRGRCPPRHGSSSRSCPSRSSRKPVPVALPALIDTTAGLALAYTAPARVCPARCFRGAPTAGRALVCAVPASIGQHPRREGAGCDQQHGQSARNHKSDVACRRARRRASRAAGGCSASTVGCATCPLPLPLPFAARSACLFGLVTPVTCPELVGPEDHRSPRSRIGMRTIEAAGPEQIVKVS